MVIALLLVVGLFSAGIDALKGDGTPSWVTKP